MADPRETARAWLAERIGWYFSSEIGEIGELTARSIAYSMASSKGVEVETEYGVLIDGVFTPRPSADDAAFEVAFCNEADPTRVRTLAQRVVIRLPAQPTGEDGTDA